LKEEEPEQEATITDPTQISGTLWTSGSGNYNSQDMISKEAVVNAGMNDKGGFIILNGTRGQWSWYVTVKDGDWTPITDGNAKGDNNGNSIKEFRGHWSTSDLSTTATGYVAIPYSAEDAQIFRSKGIRIEYGNITLSSITFLNNE